ncbi:MAG: molybdopterin cofactor-binding domain-containing protein, partial [Acidobacteriota bacterium]
MAEYNWPEAGKRSLIGGRIRRVDGPGKVSGNARYTYDVNLNGMLYGKILRSPHAHAKIKSIDTSEAESLPGVKAVRVIQEAGTEIKWAGDELVGVAALSEEIAEDALRRIKVEYEVLPHVVNEEDLSKVGDRARPAQEQRKGEPEQAFQDADAVLEGYYGQAVITHCCLEPHGQIVGWDDDENLTVWASTQAVSSIGGQLGEALEIPVPNIRVYCQNMGGGFGS